MSEVNVSSALEFDTDFDPLAEEEERVIDFDLINDDDPNDIEEMPMMPNMPEGMFKTGMFDADTYDDPREAITTLFEKNPGRRPIFLSIIEMCAEGKPSTELVSAVNDLQAENRSVYAPMTLCRALERAGALTMQKPESVEETETEEGAGFLVIQESVDPVWTSTDAGLSVLHEEQEGRAYKELFIADKEYLFMYKRVLEFVDEQPREKSEIDGLVDNDPRVQTPRRYSNHFIELLEQADALIWTDGKWTITERGSQALSSLAQA